MSLECWRINEDELGAFFVATGWTMGEVVETLQKAGVLVLDIRLDAIASAWSRTSREPLLGGRNTLYREWPELHALLNALVVDAAVGEKTS